MKARNKRRPLRLAGAACLGAFQMDCMTADPYPPDELRPGSVTVRVREEVSLEYWIATDPPPSLVRVDHRSGEAHDVVLFLQNPSCATAEWRVDRVVVRGNWPCVTSLMAVIRSRIPPERIEQVAVASITVVRR